MKGNLRNLNPTLSETREGRSKIQRGGADTDRFVHAKTISSQNLIVTAHTNSETFWGETNPNYPNMAIFVAKVNRNNFQPIWKTFIYQGAGSDWYVSSVETKGEDFYISYKDEEIGNRGNNLWLARYNKDGTLVQEEQIVNAATCIDGYIAFSGNNLLYAYGKLSGGKEAVYLDSRPIGDLSSTNWTDNYQIDSEENRIMGAWADDTYFYTTGTIFYLGFTNRAWFASRHDHDGSNPILKRNYPISVGDNDHNTVYGRDFCYMLLFDTSGTYVYDKDFLGFFNNYQVNTGVSVESAYFNGSGFLNLEDTKSKFAFNANPFEISIRSGLNAPRNDQRYFHIYQDASNEAYLDFDQTNNLIKLFV